MNTLITVPSMSTRIVNGVLAPIPCAAVATAAASVPFVTLRMTQLAPSIPASQQLNPPGSDSSTPLTLLVLLAMRSQTVPNCGSDPLPTNTSRVVPACV